MPRRNGGTGDGEDRDEGVHKVETGVAEINNSLCSAMFQLVLSDEALRSQKPLGRTSREIVKLRNCTCTSSSNFPATYFAPWLRFFIIRFWF